jgi:hypothetical protein
MRSRGKVATPGEGGVWVLDSTDESADRDEEGVRGVE